MDITSVTYANPEQTSLTVDTVDEGAMTVPWPCQTWHREEIEDWLGEGGVIGAYTAPPPPAEQVRDDEFKALPDRQAVLDKLQNATPQQISDWVDASVTNVAGARAMFKQLIFILATNVRS